MEKSMNSLKAAMVIIVLGLAGLFASCSSDSANTLDPVTPSTQEKTQEQSQEQTKAEVAKVKLTCNYSFSDSTLFYGNAKVVYTDATGKEQTQVIDKSNCTSEGDSVYHYTLNMESTTFPATMTAKLEMGANEEALENAKTGGWIGVTQEIYYTTYDKSGKEIKTTEAFFSGDKARIVLLKAEKMQEFFLPWIQKFMTTKKMDKTFTFTVDSSANISYDLK